MNFRKVDSLIRLKERACQKQTLLRMMANPNKSGSARKISRNRVAVKKLVDRDALIH